MKKQVGKAGITFLMLLCMGAGFGCASDRSAEESMKEQETEEKIEEKIETGIKTEIKEETEETEQTEQTSAQEPDGQEASEEYSPERQIKKNEEIFYEESGKQGIDHQTAAEYLQVLMEDNIFRDGAMELTGLQIDDIDGNGQKDMLVMVLDAREKVFYGSGSLWFYINDDEPYCFSEEDCSYYGWYNAFWDDIDNDENVEIVFSAQGSGCGAVGDSYKAVFKYRNHAIEQMQLPSDYEEDYDRGLNISVFQEPETDRYSAYCPYFDETVFFHAENVEGWELPDTTRGVGGNARGFFNLCVVDYEGKNALQASEYLYGEGGIAHYVATAQFLITWKEDGTPEVVRWWIEE